MSTGQQQRTTQTTYKEPSQPKPPPAAEVREPEVRFVPLGETNEIVITWGMVRKFLVKPTAKGALPDDSEVMYFMQLCKSRGLNPFAKDAFLVGYDSKNYGPQFSTIVGIQAILKRAEINPAYDGMESGVVVEIDGELHELHGDFVPLKAKLAGGWAKVYRKDRRVVDYQKLELAVYKKPSPFWDNDPGGMIAKCAEAAALRQAFPSDVGGLYLRAEIDAMGDVSRDAIRKELDKPETRRVLGGLLQQGPVKSLAAQAEQLPDPPKPESIPFDHRTAKERFADATTIEEIDALRAEEEAKTTTDDERTLVDVLATEAKERLKGGE
jgi:phage recombination protein Bet